MASRRSLKDNCTIQAGIKQQACHTGQQLLTNGEMAIGGIGGSFKLAPMRETMTGDDLARGGVVILATNHIPDYLHFSVQGHGHLKTTVVFAPVAPKTMVHGVK